MGAERKIIRNIQIPAKITIVDNKEKDETLNVKTESGQILMGASPKKITLFSQLFERVNPTIDKKLFNTLVVDKSEEDIKPYEAIPVGYPGNDTGIGLTKEQKDDVNGLYKYSSKGFQYGLIHSGTDMTNSVVLYKGNMFVNGKCYGSYTGHLENKSAITDLSIKVDGMNKAISEQDEKINNLSGDLGNISIEEAESIPIDELNNILK